jgi:hypothetical protein
MCFLLLPAAAAVAAAAVGNNHLRVMRFCDALFHP